MRFGQKFSRNNSDFSQHGLVNNLKAEILDRIP